MKGQLIKVDNRVQTRRYRMRRWINKFTVILAILSPFIFIIAALGAKIGLWSWGFGLGTLSRNIGPKVLMLTLLLGVISLVLAFIIKPRRGLFAALLALLIGGGGIIKLGGVKKKVASLPFIHDITTDTQSPPEFTQVILSERAKTPNVNSTDYSGKRDLREKELVSVLQVSTYPEIRPILKSLPPAEVFGEVRAVARSLGWKIVNEDVDVGILEATDTTFWYGFKDDIVIRVRPAEGGGTIVDARSVSRVGASDLGKNAERLGQFIKAME